MKLKWYDHAIFAIFLMTAACVLMLVFAKPARAEQGDTWGVATCCSKHTSGVHNERNFGLGFEHEAWRDTRLAAGYFRTSNPKLHIDGTYVLVAHCLVTWRPGDSRICLGGAGGVASGYALRVKYIVFPFAGYEWHRFVGANVSYFKEQEGSGANVFGLQLKTTGKWEPFK